MHHPGDKFPPFFFFLQRVLSGRLVRAALRSVSVFSRILWSVTVAMVPASVNLVTRATPARKVSALSQYAALRCYYCIDVYIITDGFIQTFWTNINKDIWYICRHAVRQRKGKKLFARKVNRYHFQSSFPEYVDVRNLWYNQLRFTKCSLNEDRKSMSHSLKWTRLVPVCSSYIWVLCPVFRV